MSELDWRSILRRYMHAVMLDDHVVALRCAETDFEGTDEEKQALKQIAQELWDQVGGAA